MAAYGDRRRIHGFRLGVKIVDEGCEAFPADPAVRNAELAAELLRSDLAQGFARAGRPELHEDEVDTGVLGINHGIGSPGRGHDQHGEQRTDKFFHGGEGTGLSARDCSRIRASSCRQHSIGPATALGSSLVVKFPRNSLLPFPDRDVRYLK